MSRPERDPLTSRRRTAVAVGVLIALVVALGVVHGLSLRERRRQADAAAIAAQAEAVRGVDPSLAAQFDLAARRLAPGVGADSRVLADADAGLSRRLVDSPGPLDAGALSPDGATFAGAGTDGALRWWPLPPSGGSEAAAPPVVDTTNDSYQAVAWSPDGRTVAAVGAFGPVRLWDVSDRSHPVAREPLEQAQARSLAFSPDSKTLAVAGSVAWAGSTDRQVTLWDLTDPAQPVALPGPPSCPGQADSVAFSPDGRMLAAGGENGLRWWSLADRSRPVPLGGPVPGSGDVAGSVDATSAVDVVAFSPDAGTAATGTEDGTLRLWDLSGSSRPTVLRDVARPDRPVRGVSFSPDGRVLAADEVTDLEFTADGRTLAMATGYGGVRWWNRDVGSATGRICAATAGTLTLDRWRRYLPGVAFSPACPSAR